MAEGMRLDAGSIVLLVGIVVIAMVLFGGRGQRNPAPRAAQHNPAPAAPAEHPSVQASIMSQGNYLQSAQPRQRYVGMGPPATGYESLRATYSGEWEPSAEDQGEPGPGIIAPKLKTLQAFNRGLQRGSLAAPPLQGRKGGVQFIDGVDIAMPVLRSESRADTGFHGKLFEDKSGLLTGVV